MTFQLDTFGVIERGEAYGGRFIWDDLSPFAQGYIEALFASAATMKTYDGRIGAKTAKVRNLAFSDLAPETLARIIADCERAQTFRQHKAGYTAAEQHGRFFWTDRQRGCQGGFPPLTVQLGDDGKVRFAE